MVKPVHMQREADGAVSECRVNKNKIEINKKNPPHRQVLVVSWFGAAVTAGRHCCFGVVDDGRVEVVVVMVLTQKCH
jgi:hypothetical protein